MRPAGISFMIVTFGIDLLILLAPFFGGLQDAFASLLIKMIADFIFLHVLLKKQGHIDALRYFLSFEGYFIFYVLILPFVVFFGGRVVWKGRVY